MYNFNFFWVTWTFSQRLLGPDIAVRHEHEESQVELGLECAALSILRKGAEGSRQN
jgi:hypothetical protein